MLTNPRTPDAVPAIAPMGSRANATPVGVINVRKQFPKASTPTHTQNDGLPSAASTMASRATLVATPAMRIATATRWAPCRSMNRLTMKKPMAMRAPPTANRGANHPARP